MAGQNRRHHLDLLNDATSRRQIESLEFGANVLEEEVWARSHYEIPIQKRARFGTSRKLRKSLQGGGATGKQRLFCGRREKGEDYGVGKG